MLQILRYFTWALFLALIITFTLGVMSWSDNALLKQSDDWNYPWHLYFGLFTVIGGLGLHCLIFIYFLGTGRWVKEVAIAYGIPDDPLPKETRELKRKAFPPALFAMLIPIATAAAGMAQYRAVDPKPGEWVVILHLGLAVLTLLINFWAYRVEHRCVKRNAELIQEVMVEVERIRQERGLPPNAEAWEEQQRQAT